MTTPALAWRVVAAGRGWRYAFRVPDAGYVATALTQPMARFALVAIIVLLVGAASLRRVWSPRPGIP